MHQLISLDIALDAVSEPVTLKRPYHVEDYVSAESHPRKPGRAINLCQLQVVVVSGPKGCTTRLGAWNWAWAEA